MADAFSVDEETGLAIHRYARPPAAAVDPNGFVNLSVTVRVLVLHSRPAFLLGAELCSAQLGKYAASVPYSQYPATGRRLSSRRHTIDRFTGWPSPTSAREQSSDTRAPCAARCSTLSRRDLPVCSCHSADSIHQTFSARVWIQLSYVVPGAIKEHIESDKDFWCSLVHTPASGRAVWLCTAVLRAA